MTDLEKALYFLAVEVKGLRADLKNKSNNELLLSERNEKKEKLIGLVEKFNNRLGGINGN